MRDDAREPLLERLFRGEVRAAVRVPLRLNVFEAPLLRLELGEQSAYLEQLGLALNKTKQNDRHQRRKGGMYMR